MVTRWAKLFWGAWGVFAVASALAQQPKEYQLGDVPEHDIVTPIPLLVVDEAATHILRAREAQRVPAIFRYDPAVAGEVEEAFRLAVDRVRSRFTNAMVTTFKRRRLDPQTVAAPRFERFTTNFQRQIKGFPLGTDLFAVWARGDSDAALLAGWAEKLRQGMSRYIRADALPADIKLGQQVRVLTLSNTGSEPALEPVESAGTVVARTNLYALSRARAELQGSFSTEQQAIGRYLAGFLRPNCTLEAELTRQVRARAVESLWAADHYDPGQVVANAGQPIDAKTKAALDQLREKLAAAQRAAGPEKSPQLWWAKVRGRPWFVGGLLAVGAGGALALGFMIRRRRRQRLLPARLAADGSVAAVISCPTCTENIVIPAGPVPETGLPTAVAAQLARLLNHKLVRRLISQRADLLDAQRQAAQEVLDLEARLEKIHAPLQDRLRTYEKRIAELERELAAKGEENRALTQAKISLIRKQLETARSQTLEDQN